VTVASRGVISVPEAGALSLDERRRISVRLGTGLVGVGLLALGTILVRVEPDQWQIGELFRFFAAAVVGVPTLIAGLRGIVTGDTRRPPVRGAQRARRPGGNRWHSCAQCAAGHAIAERRRGSRRPE
jgi:hypothetical protein